MGKSALLYTLVFAATTSFASVSQANEYTEAYKVNAAPIRNYQSIRMFQTDSQFKQAVLADTVVVSLPNNLLLKRPLGVSTASKRIENVMAMRGADGRITKELVVRCELKQLTRKRSVVLPHTSGTSNPWRVLEVKNVGLATATWVLGREDAHRVEMNCVSFERDGDESIEVPLTASMINRALSKVNGAVMTEVQPVEMALNGLPYNDVTAPAATFQDVAR